MLAFLDNLLGALLAVDIFQQVLYFLVRRLLSLEQLCQAIVSLLFGSSRSLIRVALRSFLINLSLNELIYGWQFDVRDGAVLRHLRRKFVRSQVAWNAIHDNGAIFVHLFVAILQSLELQLLFVYPGLQKPSPDFVHPCRGLKIDYCVCYFILSFDAFLAFAAEGLLQAYPVDDRISLLLQTKILNELLRYVDSFWEIGEEQRALTQSCVGILSGSQVFGEVLQGMLDLGHLVSNI